MRLNRVQVPVGIEQRAGPATRDVDVVDARRNLDLRNLLNKLSSDGSEVAPVRCGFEKPTAVPCAPPGRIHVPFERRSQQEFTSGGPLDELPRGILVQ